MTDLLIDQGDGTVWSKEKNRVLSPQDLIDRIDELERDLHETQVERSRLKESLFSIKSLNAERGKTLEAAFDGEGVTMFINLMAEWFEDQGGKNYVSARCQKGVDEFEFTMRRAGAKTPSEIAAEERSRADNAESSIEDILLDIRTALAYVEGNSELAQNMRGILNNTLRKHGS